MARYEAHLTYAVGHAKRVQQAGQDYHWVYSQITGCPLLGPGTYCYLTSYDTEHERLLRNLAKVVQLVGAPCIRAKVEQIIYDTKTGVNETGVASPLLFDALTD